MGDYMRDAYERAELHPLPASLREREIMERYEEEARSGNRVAAVVVIAIVALITLAPVVAWWYAS